MVGTRTRAASSIGLSRSGWSTAPWQRLKADLLSVVLRVERLEMIDCYLSFDEFSPFRSSAHSLTWKGPESTQQKKTVKTYYKSKSGILAMSSL